MVTYEWKNWIQKFGYWIIEFWLLNYWIIEFIHVHPHYIVLWPVFEEVQQMDFPNPSAKEKIFQFRFLSILEYKSKKFSFKKKFHIFVSNFSKGAGLWSLGKMDAWECRKLLSLQKKSGVQIDK